MILIRIIILIYSHMFHVYEIYKLYKEGFDSQLSHIQLLELRIVSLTNSYVH